MREAKLSPRDGTLPYVLHLPNAKPPAGGYPLLLFLHGVGECGADLERVKTHGPPRLAATGAKQFPFAVVSPQCRADWTAHVSDLLALLKQLTASYSIDTRRLYATGMSLGAAGVWSMLEKYPDLFAAVVLVSPYGDTSRAANHKDVPTWIFLRENDPRVTPAQSRFLFQALAATSVPTATVQSVREGRANPATVKLTVWPPVAKERPEGERHDAWTVTYDQDGVYEWLCEHARQTTPQSLVDDETRPRHPHEARAQAVENETPVANSQSANSDAQTPTSTEGRGPAMPSATTNNAASTGTEPSTTAPSNIEQPSVGSTSTPPTAPSQPTSVSVASTGAGANTQPALPPNSLCPGPCLEASADTFIYQGTYAAFFIPGAAKPKTGGATGPISDHQKEENHQLAMLAGEPQFRALTSKLKAVARADKIRKAIETSLPNSHEPLFQLGVLFRERVRTRPMGFTIERAPFYEISIPPGDMVTLTQRSFSRRSRTLQEELASESEQKLELSSSFTTEMNDELTRVIENSSQWSEGTSASAGVGYSIYSASLGYQNSTTLTQMETETARKMQRFVEESVRKIESRQKSSHKTTMEVTSEESLANESVRVLHNYSPTLKKVYMRRMLQVLHVTHERYDAQLCWAPCVEKPKQSFVMTSAVAAKIQEIEDSWRNRVPPAGTLSVEVPIERIDEVGSGEFHAWSDHRHIQKFFNVPARYQIAAVHVDEDGNDYTTMFLPPDTNCPKGEQEHYPNPIGGTGSHVEIWAHLGKSYAGNIDWTMSVTLAPTQGWIDEYNAALQAWRDAQVQAEIDAYLATLQESSPEFAWSPHSAMRAVIKQNFAGDGSPGLPDLSRDPGCHVIERMHALFEWENMSIRFFPPAWSHVDDYERETSVENASAAKVFIPIRKGMEAQAAELLRAYGAVPQDDGTDNVIQTAIDELTNVILPKYARRYAPGNAEDQNILAPNDISLTERGERVWRNAFEEESRFQIIDRFVTTVPTDGVDFEEAVSACPIVYPVAPGSGAANGAGGKGGKDKGKDKDKDDDKGHKHEDDDRDRGRDDDEDGDE